MSVAYRSQTVITEICAGKRMKLNSTRWATCYTLQDLIKLKVN